MIISVKNISKSFGEKNIFHELSATIENNDRIGLIGANGAGKTTLLQILCGQLEHDAGQVMVKDRLRIGYLRQNVQFESDKTVMEEMRGVFSNELDMQKQIKEIAGKMADMESSTQEYKRLAEQYTRRLELFEARDGYNIDVKINTVLNGMKFGRDKDHKITRTLSGGEKTRLALCKLLLEEPEILILDEPTNHLDFLMLLWLENYLKSYQGAILIVSHDRYFLDRAADKIWEIENGRLYSYSGNYTKYVELKKERTERQKKEYELQQQKIASMEDFIAKNMARASTSARAKSQQKALDRMNCVERVSLPPPSPKLKFAFDRDPVKDVLKVQKLNLTVGKGERQKQLLENINFEIKRGEKVAIVGENGVGKTTLLKSLFNQGACDGKIFWGDHVFVSYFDQDNTMLWQNNTILDEMKRFFPLVDDRILRGILGSLGLSGDDVFKKVSDLSGGERAKLKFSVMMQKRGNVLILDEPTNHLDLSMQEALDEALMVFKGTVIMVSHDRYLLNCVPDRMIEISTQGLTSITGNFSDYIEKIAILSKEDKTGKKEKTENQSSMTYYRSKQQRSKQLSIKNELSKTENEIAVEEQEILNLQTQMQNQDNASDFKRLEEICCEIEKKRLNVTHLMGKWEKLSKENEDFNHHNENV